MAGRRFAEGVGLLERAQERAAAVHGLLASGRTDLWAAQETAL